MCAYAFVIVDGVQRGKGKRRDHRDAENAAPYESISLLAYGFAMAPPRHKALPAIMRMLVYFPLSMCHPGLTHWPLRMTKTSVTRPVLVLR